MSIIENIATAGVALSLTGCAIHPVPEDVTGVPTYVIVRQIRCEARDTIRNDIIGFLSRYNGYSDVTDYANKLQSNSEEWKAFSSNRFSDGLKDTIAKYENAGLAYDFTFDMTETDKLDGTIGFTHPLSKLIENFGVSAGVDRIRENTRSFTITDKFSDLISKVDDRYCVPGSPPAQGNYMYPITGRIGMDEMVSEFFDLSYYGNLATPSGKTGAPPTLTDALKFTTTLSGSISPTLTFTPVGHGWQLGNASLTSAGASRQDLHEVIVAIAMPAKASAKAPVALLNVPANKSDGEKAAVAAAEQYILRFEVGKANIIINP